MWHLTCGLTHLWCPLAALPAICSVSVRGGLWPSAPLHSDFWVWTQPAWSSRRQHAVSRSWTQAEFNKVGKCRELPLWQKAGHSLWLIDRTEIRIVVVFFVSIYFADIEWRVWCDGVRTLFLSSCICLSIVSSHRIHGPSLAPKWTRSSWKWETFTFH